MKIGIVTQPIKANYGGVLQNFALQKVLRDMGHQPVTIDYRDSSPLWFYILQTAKTMLLTLIPGSKRSFTPYRNVYVRDNKIMGFVNNNISLTDKEYFSYDKKILREYGIEAVVVGSDQVWRPAYNPDCLYDTFLDFAKDYPCKKVAYAASFGVDNWEFTPQQTQKCSKLAQLFDAISVRENSGVSLCKEKLNVDAVEVLDPTLLLNKADYQNVCVNVPKKQKKYVCCYILDINEEKREIVKRFAERNGYELNLFTAHNNLSCTVEEWLAMFRDAEFVITDSFHGTVFSIIFNKPFYVLINESRGSSRFTSLLSKFDLQHRITREIEKDSEAIDWNAVNTKRFELAEYSKQFLSTALSYNEL